jgi:hypothetical protein
MSANISIAVEITLSQLIISVNGLLLTNDTSTSRVLPIDQAVQKNFNPVESNWFTLMRLATGCG